jgi:hypothetical protein
MLPKDVAHYIKRTMECLALAALAVGFSIQSARGQVSQGAAAAALIAKLSIAGLCFAYAKARERDTVACAEILRAGEAMLEAARLFILGLAAQFVADKAGLGEWAYLGPTTRVVIAAFYLLAFAYFIRGFDLLGESLRLRRQVRTQGASLTESPSRIPAG